MKITVLNTQTICLQGSRWFAVLNGKQEVRELIRLLTNALFQINSLEEKEVPFDQAGINAGKEKSTS